MKDALSLARPAPLSLPSLAGLKTLVGTVGLFLVLCSLFFLALGGAAAGIAGIVEASVMEGRLQAGVGAGAGYSGFLVAFLARGKLAALLPLAFAVAALAAAGDNLQLAADLPSSVVYVLQGLLFVAALVVSRHAANREREVAA
jgi:simple sugar transport system permease protein